MNQVAFGCGSIVLLAGVLIFRTPVFPAATPKTKPKPVSTSHKSKMPSEPMPAIINLEAPTKNNLPALADLNSFTGKKELDDYRLLSKKVFLTDQERLQKQALLKNEQFIQQLKNFFNTARDDHDLENQQNAAVDFLLAALNGEAGAEAAKVLKSIIQNPSTEDAHLSMALRQNMAGLKAEVLYKWSAQEPHKAHEMQQWLPGPVSQKIWKNILAQQDMNRAESALTK